MDFKQWKLYPLEEDNYQDFDDEHEEDDMLSLCDLALSNNTTHVSDSDGSFQEEQSSSLNQDLFEFFSSDFTSTISTYPEDNIIFCGKMIPCKGKNEIQGPINSESISKATKKSFVFPWKNSYSLNIMRSTSVKMERVKSYRTCKTFPESTTEEKYLAMKNVSVGERRPKSRWNLFPFGVGRYRGEMDLKDIKTRQSKLSDEKKRWSLKYDGTEEIPICKREQRWWSLARILGCQSSHANAIRVQ